MNEYIFNLKNHTQRGFSLGRLNFFLKSSVACPVLLLRSGANADVLKTYWAELQGCDYFQE